MTARTSGDRFGFQFATSDFADLVKDDVINWIVITTRHNLHAEQAIAAMEAGKHVFIEKPLALTIDELCDVMRVQKRTEQRLMVGFNRRYSKPAARIKDKLDNAGVPALFHYRINAGFIPKESPLQDDRIGKGRIIGEVCHFIDLMAYLCDARPTEVFAMSIEGGNQSYMNSDNVQITVRFSDGSAGSITYAACGGAGMPKERLEVFAGQQSFVIDDFRSAEMYCDGSRSVLYSKGQAKGHAEEFEYFADRILSGDTLTEDFKQAVCVTRATFAAIESLKTGLPQRID
jgi:polar amino acid transport system substrate-binding protein